MAVSRRNFLVAGQTLLAAAALPMKFFGAAGALNLGSSDVDVLASANRGTFLPLVNSSFAVRSGLLTPAWLTLLSVEDMNPKNPIHARPMAFAQRVPKVAPPALDTFALHFYGTGEKLQQGTYELEHHSLGRFSLFLVPSGTPTYIAVISHLLGGAPIAGPKRVNSKGKAGVQAEL